jgi:hypothetical protein
MNESKLRLASGICWGQKIGRFDVVAEYFIDDNSNYNYYYYGSADRNRAMALKHCYCFKKQKAFAMATKLAKDMSSDQWMSTQTRRMVCMQWLNFL